MGDTTLGDVKLEALLITIKAKIISEASKRSFPIRLLFVLGSM